MSLNKLLLLTPDFPPQEGGVARYLKALTEHFKDRIEVLTEPHSAWHTVDPNAGIPIYRAHLLSKWLWPHWLKTVYTLWKYRSRYHMILTSHVLPIGTAAYFAKKFTHIPYVVFLHGMDVRLAKTSKRKIDLTRKILKGAHLVVANSQALAREVVQMYGVQEVLVVYPCVDELKTNHLEKDVSEPFQLLTVSRLVERKGHSHVLNALAHLKGTGDLRSFVYHIVGEGPMEETLKSMVSALDLQAYVKFHGAVTDEERSEYYAQADVFVMPVSQDPIDKEGFGLVFIEAAQAGVPSISTAIEGVDEAVIHGQTGILLPDQTEQQLANAILAMYRDTALRAEFSRNAKEHAKQFLCEAQMSKLDPYL
ncbi:glycosyltransferase family 4 protein [Candidatus Uhrbacteria bacterium]|nr:glycosyltransferase family 4 protein [Candidatus Uhrbacteria bacterium]